MRGVFDLKVRRKPQAFAAVAVILVCYLGRPRVQLEAAPKVRKIHFRCGRSNVHPP
jgi:hypothetical protein